MEKSAGSRLLQIQARFQQKQMQERELKIANLYEAQQARALDRVRHSPSSGQKQSPSHSVPDVQPGKVRQMFEERRIKTKAGIDKSYPLQPIHNTVRPAARKNVSNGHVKIAATKSRVVEKKVQNSVNLHSVRKQQQKIENKIVNGSGDLNHNHQLDMNIIKQTTQHQNGDFNSAFQVLERIDNNCLLEDETFPDALAPLTTPRSPEPKQEPKRPPRRSPAPRDSPVETKPRPAPVAPPRRTAENVLAANRSVDAMQQGAKSPVPKKLSSQLRTSSKSRVTASTTAVSEAGGSSGVSRPGGASGAGDACAVCGRHFAPDRLQKHQDICKKTHAKKRKPFDALKHRLAGTEAEPLIGKIRKKVTQKSSVTVEKPLNNNWRQKHEEFIAAIRAAKQVQEHVKAGGKLSDLPPPPPSENPDYVRCPHCNRRFNQAAADRHIPQCASFQFNKPKPSTRRR